MPLAVALSEVLGALSYALDITEGEPPGHAVRTTAIGMRLAEQAGVLEEERSALFYALLLKDAGCSSNASRLSSLFAADDQAAKRAMKVTDWSKPATRAAYTWKSVAQGGGTLAKARRLRRITQEGEVTRELIGTRCERGAEIARMLELPEPTADAIRALDEHWDGSGQPLGLRGEAIPLLGRILCLAQTVEVFIRTVGLPGALAMALKRRNRWFDPALVDALLSIRDDRAFWGPLEDARAVPAVAALGAGRPRPHRRRRHARPRRRRVRPRDRCEVALHRAPLERGRPLAVATRLGHGRAGRGPARPAPRRPAARHRQARRLEPDPRQARQARSRTSCARSAHTRGTRSRSSSASPACGRSSSPRPRTTSGSTVPATTAASPPSTSRGPRGSSPSPTSTRR